MQNITFTTNVGKNTLEYLKLLMRSFKMNLDNDGHQIIVFIDADNEGILEYLLSIKQDFKDLCIIKNNLDLPIGYQRNKTILTEHAKYDIISYLQSDMVIGPHYDTEIIKHAKKGRILSATRVEPPLHGESDATITKNMGLRPEEFDMEAWNAFSNSMKEDRIIPYFFAPITYHKDDWMALDGYDTVFRRSREDSDLVQRCLHMGLELVQTFSANVYHFTCVTSRGQNWFDPNNTEAQHRLKVQQQADTVEFRRYVKKWGKFNHGAEKVYKLDIDLVVDNYTLDIIRQVEPFFSRVWLKTEEHKKQIIHIYDEAFHNPANYLLGISNEMWQQHKHLYRQEDFEQTFKVGTPSEYGIKVIADFSKIRSPNQFFDNLHNLHELLKDTEPGEYELDNVLISVKNVSVVSPDIKVNNPPLDKNLLTIY